MKLTDYGTTTLNPPLNCCAFCPTLVLLMVVTLFPIEDVCQARTIEYRNTQRACDGCTFQYKHEYKVTDQIDSFEIVAFTRKENPVPVNVVQSYRGASYTVISDGKFVLVAVSDSDSHSEIPLWMGLRSRSSFSPDLRYSHYTVRPMDSSGRNTVLYYVIDWESTIDAEPTVVHPIPLTDSPEMESSIFETVPPSWHWDGDNKRAVFLVHDRNDVFNVAVLPLWDSALLGHICYVPFTEYIQRPENVAVRYTEVRRLSMVGGVVLIEMNARDGVKTTFSIDLNWKFLSKSDSSARDCIPLERT